MARKRATATKVEEELEMYVPRKRTRAVKAEKVVKPKFVEEREIQIKPIVAKTDNQKKYLDSLQKNMLTVGRGSAGVGKTYLAACVAANKYLKGEVDKIVVMRSATRMGANTGFYPGTVEEKLAFFLAPILNTIKERVGYARYEAEFGKSIVIQPMEAVRGMSFKSKTYLICDETQNVSLEEIRSLVTRLEEGCQIALCGDDKQKDLKGLSGIEYVCNLVKRHKIPNCGIVEFTTDDIVRSGLTKRFVEIFEQEGPVSNVERAYEKGELI